MSAAAPMPKPRATAPAMSRKNLPSILLPSVFSGLCRTRDMYAHRAAALAAPYAPIRMRNLDTRADVFFGLRTTSLRQRCR